MLCEYLEYDFQIPGQQHSQKNQNTHSSADINLDIFYFTIFRTVWKPNVEFSNSVCSVLKISLCTPILPQTVESDYMGLLFAGLTLIPAQESEWNHTYLLKYHTKTTHPGGAQLQGWQRRATLHIPAQQYFVRRHWHLSLVWVLLFCFKTQTHVN